MSQINNLIHEIQNTLVEWKPLGEVTEFVRGLTYSKADESHNNQGYKVLRANNITLSSNLLNFNDIKIVKLSTKIKDIQKLYKNDILISIASGSREHIGKVAYINSDINYYFGGFMGVIRCYKKLNSRYLFHVLTSDIFQYYLNESLKTSTINNISSSLIKTFKIPIPPLELQERIVKILDTFTELTTELTTELKNRKKQYTFYRDKLLSFKENKVEWKPLGEVGEFVRGKNLQKKDFTENGVGCIHYGQIYTQYGLSADKTKTFISEEFAKKARKAQTGNLVIATTSENDEDVCKAVVWLGKEEIAVSSDACIYKHNLNPKYVSYFFKTENFQTKKKKYITGTKVRRVNTDNLVKIKIPTPPLALQERIVKILDKFDTLVNSISEGLPKEIDLRKKQYEYYRNALLNFSKE